MACPVCSGEAEKVRIFDRITIYCPVCEPYELSGTVHDTRALQKRGPDERRSILERAKQRVTSGERPYINRDDVSCVGTP
jgi:ribosomal protein L44E